MIVVTAGGCRGRPAKPIGFTPIMLPASMVIGYHSLFDDC